MKPIGPSSIDANLQLAIEHNQHVRRAQVRCPRSSGYPIACRLTGTALVSGKLSTIAGTVTVLGVETSTRTYAYEIEYSPLARR